MSVCLSFCLSLSSFVFFLLFLLSYSLRITFLSNPCHIIPRRVMSCCSVQMDRDDEGKQRQRQRHSIRECGGGQRHHARPYPCCSRGAPGKPADSTGLSSDLHLSFHPSPVVLSSFMFEMPAITPLSTARHGTAQPHPLS